MPGCANGPTWCLLQTLMPWKYEMCSYSWWEILSTAKTSTRTRITWLWSKQNTMQTKVDVQLDFNITQHGQCLLFTAKCTHLHRETRLDYLGFNTPPDVSRFWPLQEIIYYITDNYWQKTVQCTCKQLNLVHWKPSAMRPKHYKMVKQRKSDAKTRLFSFAFVSSSLSG